MKFYKPNNIIIVYNVKATTDKDNDYYYYKLSLSLFLFLYLPQNKQVRLFEGHNLIPEVLETLCLSKVPQQATHE